MELIAFQSGHWIISEQLRNLDLPATTAQRDSLTKAGAEMVNRARDDGAIRPDIDPSMTMVLIRRDDPRDRPIAVGITPTR